MKIAILGSGQLAQLLSHAAYPLGVQTLCINTAEIKNTEQKAQILKLIQEFKPDSVTLENENLDIFLLSEIAKNHFIYPPIDSIRVSQNRLFEKTLFENLNIPTPESIEINNLQDLKKALEVTGFPAILKTRRFGYDGKGQVMIKNQNDVLTALELINFCPAILESFVKFDFEVSLISARDAQGTIIFYPLIKNTHQDGILRRSESPYKNKILQNLAENYAKKILNYFNYVGVLAFEFFVQNNNLIANELAPRVHNSGHLTIEGFHISQFEMHLRCGLGLPLSNPVMNRPTVMENIIGVFPEFNKDDYENSHIYNYGKTERPGRKLGHRVFFQGLEEV